MKRYQVKSLKKMVKYANNVKLYQDKFKETNIHPEDIKEIEDVRKLPFITKQDLRKYGNTGTIPDDFNMEKAFKVDTSGVTGKPISIYRDLNAIAAELIMSTRMIKAYNLDVFKTRLTNIGDFSIPNSYDEECIVNGVYNRLGFLASSNSTQSLYAGEDIKEIMKKLESFNPELIIAYPGTLIGLMTLRQKGYGNGLKPTYIVSGGGVLDPYMKRQIENAFDTRLLNLYGATEGGMVAFECLCGSYHVQSDYVHLGAVNEKGEDVTFGEHGHAVVTRLYGGGTPIIRYTGMNDYITLLDEECECGMHTQTLKNVEGRSIDSIVLPDGRIFPPATFTLIPSDVTQDYGVDKIQQFQIIQYRKDYIEILIVTNEELRDVGPSIEEIMNEIKKRYQKVVGKDVHIEIKEVKKVKKDERRSPTSPTSIVLSYVEHKDWI
ncbi:MAG: hypothetical protein NTV74_06300 [Euryarchaeota archaeon]|nr:hypothetical protein [Euryarchaeota archaeon]